ncbi:MAG: BON domain-containing protein [Desulfomicrobium sp.]|nr:BON domain-containing protein [Pseudomonadota bacterium]MBV1711422.1 BON domain-containing protein [Desulfomicrobium sp.]MBU4570824.1 BON domain-containing protein [Pseudomonadota bacterium]MBU4595314.1 BON domain-containing protein [Pseudomonadota bacterium]MBV1720746.1 BON domain-containing protein [Desulfomicrobium sp.]
MKTTFIRSLLFTAAVLLVFGMPLQAAESDRDIEASAKQSHVFKKYLQNDDIKIESKDGVVTMTGVVSGNYHKTLAQETVANLPGVKSVDNKLELKGTPPSANTDAWVLDNVVATLLFHRSVSPTTTQVNVKDGVVTLKGKASSQAQKELTTEYAMDVEGVKEVKNEMTVEGAQEQADDKKQTISETIDDASITTQVKMTLLYHRSTSALNTKVETMDGVVTLTGEAQNAAEATLATKLASDVNGVKEVKNQMSVK